MKFPPAPVGFLERRLPHALAWFRPEADRPIRSVWKKTGPALRLSEVARRHPESRTYAGRLPVPSAPFAAAGTFVIRPCAHGGLWGRLVRDLYRGAGRALREIRAADRLERLNIPTPRILAVIFYPAGFFCRIEIVTRMIPHSCDLVHFLKRRPPQAERRRAFSAVRNLVGQLHRHGIRHPDLNARNILLSPAPRAGWIAHLLDVDAVRWGIPSGSDVEITNRNRLLRSLLKRARKGDLGWSEAEVAGLWREILSRR